MSEIPCESIEKDMVVDWGHLSLSISLAHVDSHSVNDDVSLLHTISTLAS